MQESKGRIILLSHTGITTHAGLPVAGMVKPMVREEKGTVQIAKEGFEKMDDENKQKVIKQFETKYGTDKNTRTPEQWENLISTYGYETIYAREGLTPKQVRAIVKKIKRKKFVNGK